MTRRAALGSIALLAAMAMLWAPTTAANRPFPDTTSRIAILTDQLPGGMTPAQQRFAATHYVGTQKLTRDLSDPIRAINPAFLVLHYHLAMWQSAPRVNFIVDGRRWGNDFANVTVHEDWFWHNEQRQRVASSEDGKLLMNVSNPGFQQHWIDSLIAQAQAGDYDGVFLDSASPALLQWEARSPLDPRLQGTGVRTGTFPELGGRSWIVAWEEWIQRLDRALAARGVALIPNVGGLATGWDNTNYALTAGIFSEGFLDPEWSEADWRMAANQLLALATRRKIMILQNGLSSPSNVAHRRFLLASYLLMKGDRTYLSYSGLEWYPEWGLDLGAPQRAAATIDDLRWQGVYRRDFAKGIALVNPTAAAVTVDLGSSFKKVEPQGGGPVAPDGIAPGSIATTPVSGLTLAPHSGEILLR
jgi:hypothetical protein